MIWKKSICFYPAFSTWTSMAGRSPTGKGHRGAVFKNKCLTFAFAFGPRSPFRPPSGEEGECPAIEGHRGPKAKAKANSTFLTIPMGQGHGKLGFSLKINKNGSSFRKSVRMCASTSNVIGGPRSPGSAIEEGTFFNQCFDKGRLKNFVLWFLLNYGENRTVRLVEELKNAGFYYASKAGISLGVDDLKIPPKKIDLIYDAEKLTSLTIHQYKRGEITAVERFQRLIDTWHRTSEILKQEVIDHFEATDVLNPVYMMAFSGARGNISQVRQLVGMRGLMADPQGQILDFPIRSNFREGLTLTEYIISSYGARKGIVDTALRTANAGYLTRRLVDVAQHVIITNFDCKTKRGIYLTNMKEGNKTIYSLTQKLVGRILARDLFTTDNMNKVKIASRNEEITSDLAFQIGKKFDKVFVRSPLTCEKLICQLCYGWSLAQGRLVSIGEAVGVVAAQSIGEPGTQLTMRTFHTGGVFAGDISDLIKAPFNGVIEYASAIAGLLIRSPEGKIVFLTKSEGAFMVHARKSNNSKKIETKKYKIPPYTVLYMRNGQNVIEKEVIAQITSISQKTNATDDAEFTIKSEIEGQFYSKSIIFREKFIGPKLKKNKKNQETDPYPNPNLNLNLNSNPMSLNFDNLEFDKIYEAWTWGYAWILSGKIYEFKNPSPSLPIIGDLLNTKSYMTQINWSLSNSNENENGNGNGNGNGNSIYYLYNKRTPHGNQYSNKYSNQSIFNSLQKQKLKDGFLTVTKPKETPIPIQTTPLLFLDLKNIVYKKHGYAFKLSEKVQFISSFSYPLLSSIALPSPYFPSPFGGKRGTGSRGTPDDLGSSRGSRNLTKARFQSERNREINPKGVSEYPLLLTTKQNNSDSLFFVQTKSFSFAHSPALKQGNEPLPTASQGVKAGFAGKNKNNYNKNKIKKSYNSLKSLKEFPYLLQWFPNKYKTFTGGFFIIENPYFKFTQNQFDFISEEVQRLTTIEDPSSRPPSSPEGGREEGERPVNEGLSPASQGHAWSSRASKGAMLEEAFSSSSSSNSSNGVRFANSVSKANSSSYSVLKDKRNERLNFLKKRQILRSKFLWVPSVVFKFSNGVRFANSVSKANLIPKRTHKEGLGEVDLVTKKSANCSKFLSFYLNKKTNLLQINRQGNFNLVDDLKEVRSPAKQGNEPLPRGPVPAIEVRQPTSSVSLLSLFKQKDSTTFFKLKQSKIYNSNGVRKANSVSKANSFTSLIEGAEKRVSRAAKTGGKGRKGEKYQRNIIYSHLYVLPEYRSIRSGYYTPNFLQQLMKQQGGESLKYFCNTIQSKHFKNVPFFQKFTNRTYFFIKYLNANMNNITLSNFLEKNFMQYNSLKNKQKFLKFISTELHSRKKNVYNQNLYSLRAKFNKTFIYFSYIYESQIPSLSVGFSPSVGSLGLTISEEYRSIKNRSSNYNRVTSLANLTGDRGSLKPKTNLVKEFSQATLFLNPLLRGIDKESGKQTKQRENKICVTPSILSTNKSNKTVAVTKQALQAFTYAKAACSLSQKEKEKDVIFHGTAKKGWIFVPTSPAIEASFWNYHKKIIYAGQILFNQISFDTPVFVESLLLKDIFNIKKISSLSLSLSLSNAKQFDNFDKIEKKEMNGLVWIKNKKCRYSFMDISSTSSNSTSSNSNSNSNSNYNSNSNSNEHISFGPRWPSIAGPEEPAGSYRTGRSPFSPEGGRKGDRGPFPFFPQRGTERPANEGLRRDESRRSNEVNNKTLTNIKNSTERNTSECFGFLFQPVQEFEQMSNFETKKYISQFNNNIFDLSNMTLAKLPQLWKFSINANSQTLDHSKAKDVSKEIKEVKEVKEQLFKNLKKHLKKTIFKNSCKPAFSNKFKLPCNLFVNKSFNSLLILQMSNKNKKQESYLTPTWSSMAFTSSGLSVGTGPRSPFLKRERQAIEGRRGSFASSNPEEVRTKAASLYFPQAKANNNLVFLYKKSDFFAFAFAKSFAFISSPYLSVVKSIPHSLNNSKNSKQQYFRTFKWSKFKQDSFYNIPLAKSPQEDCTIVSDLFVKKILNKYSNSCLNSKKTVHSLLPLQKQKQLQLQLQQSQAVMVSSRRSLNLFPFLISYTNLSKIPSSLNKGQIFKLSYSPISTFDCTLYPYLYSETLRILNFYIKQTLSLSSVNPNFQMKTSLSFESNSYKSFESKAFIASLLSNVFECPCFSFYLTQSLDLSVLKNTKTQITQFLYSNNFNQTYSFFSQHSSKNKKYKKTNQVQALTNYYSPFNGELVKLNSASEYSLLLEGEQNKDFANEARPSMAGSLDDLSPPSRPPLGEEGGRNDRPSRSGHRGPFKAKVTQENQEKFPILTSKNKKSCMVLTKNDLISYYLPYSNFEATNFKIPKKETNFIEELKSREAIEMQKQTSLLAGGANHQNLKKSSQKGSQSVFRITESYERKKSNYVINDTLIKFLNMAEIENSQIYSSEEQFKGSSLTNSEQTHSFVTISKTKAGAPIFKNSPFRLSNFLKNKKNTSFSLYSKQQISISLLGDFYIYGDPIYNIYKNSEKEKTSLNSLDSLNSLNTGNTENTVLEKRFGVKISGQIIHYNTNKITLRRGQPIFISPKGVLHKLDGDFIDPKTPVITLSYQRLKNGDIIQGIPKVEQFFEARTTKRGRLFRDCLPSLLKALFKRYQSKLTLELAVRQSFYKIQQIIVDGVQRVYKSQGVTISDKHLEVIVKQMTSKVRILDGAQTGFFPGEVVDLSFVEKINQFLIKKITYEPLVLGITKASLEVDSFLSASSFQQTTRVLSQAAIYRKKDFLKGLKENVILGNLIPAGTGYLVYLDDILINN